MWGTPYFLTNIILFLIWFPNHDIRLVNQNQLAKISGQQGTTVLWRETEAHSIPSFLPLQFFLKCGSWTEMLVQTGLDNWSWRVFWCGYRQSRQTMGNPEVEIRISRRTLLLVCHTRAGMWLSPQAHSLSPVCRFLFQVWAPCNADST